MVGVQSRWQHYSTNQQVTLKVKVQGHQLEMDGLKSNHKFTLYLCFQSTSGKLTST